MSTRELWDNKWVTYYTAKQELLDAIAAAAALGDDIYYSNTTEIDGGNIRADTIDINEITVTASDVGARADDWMPSAGDVGAGSSDTSGSRMNITPSKIEIHEGTGANSLRVKLGAL